MYAMVHFTRPGDGLGLADKYQRTMGLAGAETHSLRREIAPTGGSNLWTGDGALIVGGRGRLRTQDRLALSQRRVGHSLAVLG
jgi:hypothetical protein